MTSRRQLGRSQVTVSEIGLGCWQFSQGSGVAGTFWPSLSEKTIAEIVAACCARGITWFDTAEIYGWGRSEMMLSQALLAAGKRNGEVVIATKWWPVFRFASRIQTGIEKRHSFLAPFDIDLYQIHHPLSFSSTKAEMEAMANLVADGNIRAVGVSNFSSQKLRVAHSVLAARSIPLASNQVSYSLLDRRVERNGIMDTAKELGITIIAYSPLAQGVLSGKFHNDPKLILTRPGPRKWMRAFRKEGLLRSRALIAAIQKIAYSRGATPSQVALNWLLHFHGETVVAIPGATTVGQAEENAGAMTFCLTESEMASLDALSRQFL